tara:strand:+ start:861 stop:1598 length:738 start_codon:yes stop_codon:yes gene_type:complete
MADKSMKAVIRAEVDPSGVIKGVAATNRELAKLNSKTSAIAVGASFNMAQMGFQMLMSVFRMMDRRVSEMAQMSTRFSPEAQTGVMRTKMLELQRERFMAENFGIDVAGSERVKREGIQRRAEDDAAAGTGGISFTESLKQDASSLMNAGSANFMENLMDPSKIIDKEANARRFKQLQRMMPFLSSDILDQGGRVDIGKLGTMGQEMTAGMSDNKSRDVAVKNAIIDQENLRLMREQNRLLKGGY